ncbi:Tryptophan--tRNA ligase 2 [Diplonema papillatum]|nr:Tryptophan--tRNA ligase 2 [Diplonema papillatum]
MILLTDDRKAVSKTLKRAYSGRAATLEEFREKGGCPEVEVPFAYLKHFLEDDGELAAIEEGFRKGTVHSGIMKQRAAEVVSEFLEFQHKRALKMMSTTTCAKDLSCDQRLRREPLTCFGSGAHSSLR